MTSANRCPTCSMPLPAGVAKFCPRCGGALPGRVAPGASAPPAVVVDPVTGHPVSPVVTSAGQQVPPVHVEPRGSLVNPFFVGSMVAILAGAVLVSVGQVVVGWVLLGVGLPSLLVATVRRPKK